MSRVLEFADEVAGLTPGLDQAQIITNDFTTTANKNSVFFGSITFNATNPVTVVANSELIFHDADVDFKQGFNIQGTLNWITGGGTTNKDVSGLQINGTTVIDSNRNIINVPLIQAIGIAGVSIASAVYTADNRTGTSGALTVKSPSSDVSAAAASREPVATFTGGSTDTKKLDFYIDTSAATTKTGIAAYDSSGGATELGFYTGTSATERLTIDSNGYILIDNATNKNVSTSTGFFFGAGYATFNLTSSNDYKVRFNDNESAGSTGDTIGFYKNSTLVGSISTYTSTTGYNTTSDYRIKENITDITDGIERVKLLKPSQFNFIVEPNITVDGFIAHEVSDIVPLAVTGEKDAVNEDGSIKPQGIDQSKLVPLLTAALQENIALIESQQAQIDALTARITALENQ